MTKLILRFTPDFLKRVRHADNALKQRRHLTDVHGLAREALKAACSAIDGVGAKAWLTWGSALGFLREKAFIRDDNDIDFGIPLGEMSPRLISALEERGFWLFGETKYYGVTYNYKFMMDGFTIDFYSMEDRGVEYWSRSRYGNSCLVYTHPKSNIVRREFEGAEVCVLEPIQEYVEHIYGPGWVRPPEPGWHNSFSLPNLRAIEVTPLQLPQLAGRITNWKCRGLRAAVIGR